MTKKKMDCCVDTQHPDHSKQLARLNRVAGQVEGVKRMIEQRRYCPDIITQLRAVRSALHAIETGILDTHLEACVADAFTAANPKETAKKIAELKEIYRRFNG